MILHFEAENKKLSTSERYFILKANWSGWLEISWNLSKRAKMYFFFEAKIFFKDEI